MNPSLYDFRPVAVGAMALLFGSVLGYVAFGMLEPKAPTPHYQTLRYISPSNTDAFPRTFSDRDAALTWLITEIDFLERNGSDWQQPVVERMKSELAYLVEHPEQKIQRSLLQYVREEVELRRAFMAGITPTSPGSGPIVVPHRDP